MFAGARAPKDVTLAAEQLAAEGAADEPGWRIWGVSMPDSEAHALDALVANPPAGVHRKFSRNEIVRLAVLLFMSATDAQVRAASSATPRAPRGRTTKHVELKSSSSRPRAARRG